MSSSRGHERTASRGPEISRRRSRSWSSRRAPETRASLFLVDPPCRVKARAGRRRRPAGRRRSEDVEWSERERGWRARRRRRTRRRAELLTQAAATRVASSDAGVAAPPRGRSSRPRRRERGEAAWRWPRRGREARCEPDGNRGREAGRRGASTQCLATASGRDETHGAWTGSQQDSSPAIRVAASSGREATRREARRAAAAPPTPGGSAARAVGTSRTLPRTKAASSEEMCIDSLSGPSLRLRLRRRGGDRLRLALRPRRAGDASVFIGDRLREGDRLERRREGNASRMSAS